MLIVDELPTFFFIFFFFLSTDEFPTSLLKIENIKQLINSSHTGQAFMMKFESRCSRSKPSGRYYNRRNKSFPITLLKVYEVVIGTTRDVIRYCE